MTFLETTGVSVLRFFDAYSIRARFIPAILGAAPALAAVFLMTPWKEFDLYVVITSVALLGMLYALADWARRRGQAIEPNLYRDMGGKPSVTMMYRSDKTLDDASKDRYRSFLATKVNHPAPSAQDEKDRAGFADGFYELAGTWLRTNTRDAKKFPILFNENCAYGFRRNLLGVKWPALALNVLVVAICAGVLWYNPPPSLSADMTKRVMVVLIVAAAHALYFLLGVKRKGVVLASRTYARELILSCEAFIKTRAPAKPKANAA